MAGEIQFISTKLTHEQLIGMNPTPVEIIPAPGPGLLIIVCGIFANVVGNTPYSGGGDIYLQYTGFSPLDDMFLSFRIDPRILTNLSENAVQFSPGIFASPFNSGFCVNQNVCMTNLNGPFTGGAEGQSMLVNIWYSVVPIT